MFLTILCSQNILSAKSSHKKLNENNIEIISVVILISDTKPMTDVVIDSKTTSTTANKKMKTATKTVASAKMTKFQQFLFNHLVKDKNEVKPTNTRIGSIEHEIYGGSYHISGEEYAEFINLYYQHVFVNKNKEYITEYQLESGPLLVDIDFRFDYDVSSRLYTADDIDNIIVAYLDILKEIYDFDNDDSFSIYVFEKKEINKLLEKNITKDGIHIIFGIMCDRETQRNIRQKMLEKGELIFANLPLKNKIDDVFDETIATGKTNWQLYGSRKPDNQPYELTKIFDAVYDTDDNEFAVNPIDTETFDLKNNLIKLSARYDAHPQFMFNAAYLNNKSALASASASAKTNTSYLSNNRGGGGGGDDITKQVLSVSSFDEFNALLAETLERWETSIIDHYLYDAYLYAMCLPEQFYGAGSYDKWVKVGCALCNTNNKLFIVWVAFSMQSPTFKSVVEIRELYEKWKSLDKRGVNCLTIRSIIHWAKTESADKWTDVYKKSINYYIEETLGTNLINDKKVKCRCGDYDLANVLYHLYKDKFCCGNIQSSIWYIFKDNRWVINDSGTTLRNKISTDLKAIYQEKMLSYMEQLSNETNEDKQGIYKYKIDMIIEICNRLGNTSDKQNIMKEAKEKFYDEQFLEKLDTNPYLLCFKNGVFDFKSMVFRNGVPEDYISKSTHNIYKPFEEYEKTHTDIIKEIRQFMKQLFPVPELEKYMWEHLASALMGDAKNQKFHMYIGVGRNGKSVLTTLMSETLGEYCCDVPLSIVTEKRQKIGGLSPEIVALKGVRYAVMQEPGKGERLQESSMKQLTSGLDPISCRAPYMVKNLVFIPQFKLVVCSNELMEIKSQDHGTWRRIRIIEFLSKFVEKPTTGDKESPYQYLVDGNLKEKFPEWKGVFISMLIEILKRTNGNVEDCPMVLKASDQYRQSQDVIAEFIADRIVADETQFIKKEGLGQEFNCWFQLIYGNKGAPNIKDVHSYMDKKFNMYDKYKCWKGVGFASSASHVSTHVVDEGDVGGMHDANDIVPDIKF